jgi:hypothetical protein
MKAEPRRFEIVIVLVIACAVTACGIIVAHYADLNTPNDPTFRDLVRPGSTNAWFKTAYLYGPLLFEFIGLLALATMLLPKHVQADYLHVSQWPRRLHVYLFIPWFLFCWWGVNHSASRALQAAAVLPLVR